MTPAHFLLYFLLGTLLLAAPPSSHHEQAKSMVAKKRPLKIRALHSEFLDCIEALCPDPTPKNNVYKWQTSLDGAIKVHYDRLHDRVEKIFLERATNEAFSYALLIKLLIGKPDLLNTPIPENAIPFANLLFAYEFGGIGLEGDSRLKDLALNLQDQRHLTALTERLNNMHLMNRDIEDHPDHIYSEYLKRAPLVERIRKDAESIYHKILLLHERQPELEDLIWYLSSLRVRQNPFFAKALEGSTLSKSELRVLNDHFREIDLLFEIYSNREVNAEFFVPPPKLDQIINPKKIEELTNLLSYLQSENYILDVSKTAKICTLELSKRLAAAPNAEDFKHLKERIETARGLVIKNWIGKMSKPSQSLLLKSFKETGYKLPPDAQKIEDNFFSINQEDFDTTSSFLKKVLKNQTPSLQNINRAFGYTPSSFSREYILKELIAKNCDKEKSKFWLEVDAWTHFMGSENEVVFGDGKSYTHDSIIAVAGHEFGHSLDPKVNPLLRTLSPWTKKRIKDIKSCLNSQHKINLKSDEGFQFTEEDFADFISNHFVPLSSNSYCSQLNRKALLDGDLNTINAYTTSRKEDVHSNLLFLLLHEHTSRHKGDPPKACQSYIKNSGFGFEYKNCIKELD